MRDLRKDKTKKGNVSRQLRGIRLKNEDAREYDRVYKLMPLLLV